MEKSEVRKHKKYFYTIKEKLAIIDFYNTFNSSGERLVSKQEVYRKYNIDHKSFNEWLKNEDEMRNCHDPKNKKTLHKGKPSSFSKEEKEKIINWVELQLSNFIPINYHIVANTVIAMNLESLKDISYKAKYLRIIRLLKSNYYVLRKTTHIGQSIPNDADEKTHYFLAKL